MEKQLTLKEIVEFMNLDLSNQKFKRTVSFYLASNRNLLQPHFEAYEAQRRELFEKYGEQDGENIVIPRDKTPEFLLEMKQLLDSKVTVSLSAIKLNDLPDEIELDIVQKLLFMIEDSTE